MITANFIQSLGYDRKLSYTIMMKFKALGCTLKKAKIEKTYVRHGYNCDLMYHGDAHEVSEVIEKLNHYCDNIPCNANKSLWNELLLELKGKR